MIGAGLLCWGLVAIAPSYPAPLPAVLTVLKGGMRTTVPDTNGRVETRCRVWAWRLMTLLLTGRLSVRFEP